MTWNDVLFFLIFGDLFMVLLFPVFLLGFLISLTVDALQELKRNRHVLREQDDS